MISIIVPSYNSSRTLVACLENIVDNTFSDREIIVVDDASTDDSRLMAKHFAVKLIEHTQNQGVGAARNRGASEATGDILLFVDSDVLIPKHFIAQIVDGFTSPDVNVYQGIVSGVPANANYGARCSALQWHYEEKFIFANAHESYRFHSQCCAIRRQFFMSIGGFKESYAGAGGEEFEIDNRILEKTKMHMNPELT